MFQFLILLSYECFQPKFNQAKSVFGMSRIIQVCDDIMACGQSARTHGRPQMFPNGNGTGTLLLITQLSIHARFSHTEIHSMHNLERDNCVLFII